MRISRLSMHGFGIFHDVSVDDLAPGLSLFLGDNEAGKSTTLNFVHAVLFGCTRAKWKSYEPSIGGQARGALEIETETDGRLTVERREGSKGGDITVTFPDGSPHGLSSLANALGGTTPKLYRNLYAFSLSELQNLETLTDTEVKQVIYGASLGTSARSLPEARKQLKGRMNELFLSSGKKPLLNVILKQLEKVRDAQTEATEGIGKYEQLTDQLVELTNNIEDIRLLLSTERKKHEQLKANVSLWGDWADLRAARERLAALPELVDSFPHQGVAKLDELTRKQDGQKEELRRSEEDLEEKRERLGRLSFDDAILSNDADVRGLVRDLGSFDTAIGEISLTEERLKSMRRQAKESLAEFGTGRTEESVLTLDRSPMTYTQIEAHADEIEKTGRLLEKAGDSEERFRAALNDAVSEERAATEKVEALKKGHLEVEPETLTALRDRRTKFQDVLRDIPKREVEHRTATANLETRLLEIHRDWTPETLEKFDASLTSRQRVNGYDAQLSEAMAAEREAGKARDRTITSLAEAVESVSRKSKEIADISEAARPLEVSRERKGLIRSLRELVTQRDSAKTALAAHRRTVAAMRSNPTGASGGGLGRRLRIFAGVAGALALAAGPALWYFVTPEAGGAAGGVLLFVAILLLLIGQAVSGEARAALPKDDKTNNQLQTTLETLSAEVEELQTRLGVNGEITAKTVDRLEDENTDHLRAAENLLHLQKDLRQIEEARERAERQKADAETDVAESTRRLETDREAWSSYAATLNLAAGTSPRTADAVFGKVDAARIQAGKIADIETRLSPMRDTRAKYLALMETVPCLQAAAREHSDEEKRTALAGFFADIEREEQNARLLADARAAANKTAKRRQTAEAQLDAATSERNAATRADEASGAAWVAWLGEHRMDASWSPKICPELLNRASRLTELASTRDEATEKLERLSRETQAFIESVAGLCERLGRKKPADVNLAAEVQFLETSLEDSLRQRTMHDGLAGDIPELESRCVNRRQTIQEITADIDELLAAGDTTDQELFRSRGRLFDEQQSLLQQIEDHSADVKKRSGQSDMQALEAMLAETNRSDLEADSVGAKNRVDEAENRLVALRKEHATAEEQRKQLHAQDAIAELRLEEESLLEQLRVGADDWARHAVARHLLTAATKRFEEAHQPEVIQHATRYFSSITGGRYTNVLVPHEGDEEIAVIDAKRERKAVTALSRGTAEQLYLAIRFGYIASHSSSGERLPLLMDDVLVNFDPTRASQAAAGILEMAQSHQVLFFTCHPATVEIFRRHQSDVPTYQLAKGTITGPTTGPT